MELNKNIETLIRKFAKKMAVYFNANLEEALKKGGSKNPQNPSLRINDKVEFKTNSVVISMVATDEYWKYIESGRKKGVKGVPTDKLDKKWQNTQGINAKQVINDLRTKAGLKPYKNLKYDKAVKSLAFVIQKSIKKKGIKPKPFVEQSMKEIEIDKFTQELASIISKEVTVTTNI